MQLDNARLLKQIEELAKILEPWSNQLIIGGGVALVLYDTVLSKANSGAVGTTDIDYLIPRKPIKAGDEQISKILIENGYEPKNKSMDQPAVQSFTKQLDEIEIEIEFLTDNKSRKNEDVVVIKDAGVNAQALSYIEMSLQEATPIQMPTGSSVLVVKPEAWVFHKGLTFPKRSSGAKKLKDLYGIWFALTQLNDTSIAVQKNLQKLMSKHPESWSKTFRSNLRKWMTSATPKDWDLLSMQDINGRLTKTNFENAVLKI